MPIFNAPIGVDGLDFDDVRILSATEAHQYRNKNLAAQCAILKLSVAGLMYSPGYEVSLAAVSRANASREDLDGILES